MAGITSKWVILVLLLVGIAWVVWWSRQHFNPISTDLCTWYVNTYPDMPSEYQDGIHSACDTYRGRCNTSQAWGELTSLYDQASDHLRDPSEIYSPYPYMLGRLSSDLCAEPADCEHDMDCNPLYTNLRCRLGKCQ